MQRQQYSSELCSEKSHRPSRAAIWFALIAGFTCAGANGSTLSAQPSYSVRLTPFKYTFSSQDGRVTVSTSGKYPAYTASVSDHGTEHGLAIPFGASWVRAAGVNNIGLAIGYSSQELEYFWDTAGNPVSLGEVSPLAINNNGSIAGSIFFGLGSSVAALWRNGNAVRLEAPLSGEEMHVGHALDINDAEVAVGSVRNDLTKITSAYRWEDGNSEVLKGLSDPKPFNYDSANAINAHSIIVGSSSNREGRTRATVWRNGVPVELGNVSGRRQCEAFGINAFQIIVGSCYRKLSGEITGIATLWQGEQKLDSNIFLTKAQQAEWQLVSAHQVNDRGEIFGNATHRKSKRNVSFVLSPRR